jgi:oligosaccharyltransferase complex subunit beta
MRSLVTLLLLALLAAVQAVSTAGNRLLVVLEDTAEKSKYSKFWGDLEGKTAHMILCLGRNSADD